ncbi:MAG: SMC-Scp complex subunit ScpB [Deltaproteobacteria bacterium GWA2_38_16]|nr:MAG: SMC-Scp complex subunit ScpB [Deltaproteobacteria bacterium GWA2_38_16]OGQ03142.1 MAG: SMC-Scp complex subunit ScpB [Deltaproteobacteria bacterium RIFCSPHIGHO2_02_FULL_38_15]OGQ34690.1 MAG: SMC-Scp complex subunit ScpB [Deltaproteobacteria bacterium RIFCSPLOWO2_01_FULL_38_9]OGQ61769.1 MAG: SMC-Scp complex subunit ScpB [Deltaproteobacteria bacterium RIFCSPLOWO2_12_FULL_38_8]HBQ20435.1 SMC-Scp complex subunit ScpB [Deltaproteobacteria bacterium]
MQLEHLESVVEALLFSSDQPVTLKKLQAVIPEASLQELRTAIADIQKNYEMSQRGICLEEIAEGYQFRTKLDKASWVKKLIEAGPMRMTRAQLETLSMIAYKQPVTRIEIDAIRGVDSSSILKILVDKKLIRIVGMKEVPGRPLLYGTTIEFLEFFNLKDLSQLPSLEQLRELKGREKSDMPLFAKDTVEEAELIADQSSNLTKSSGS